MGSFGVGRGELYCAGKLARIGFRFWTRAGGRTMAGLIADEIMV